ncbi:hypothetical protein DFH06DRAFT_1133733 [Mycena polygramma]|nr:hypothetical protein DFH06DRAFT_1133733 [Mycena polygramma]
MLSTRMSGVWVCWKELIIVSAAVKNGCPKKEGPISLAETLETSTPGDRGGLIKKRTNAPANKSARFAAGVSSWTPSVRRASFQSSGLVQSRHLPTFPPPHPRFPPGAGLLLCDSLSRRPRGRAPLADDGVEMRGPQGAGAASDGAAARVSARIRAPVLRNLRTESALWGTTERGMSGMGRRTDIERRNRRVRRVIGGCKDDNCARMEGGMGRNRGRRRRRGEAYEKKARRTQDSRLRASAQGARSERWLLRLYRSIAKRHRCEDGVGRHGDDWAARRQGTIEQWIARLLCTTEINAAFFGVWRLRVARAHCRAQDVHRDRKKPVYTTCHTVCVEPRQGFMLRACALPGATRSVVADWRDYSRGGVGIAEGGVGGFDERDGVLDVGGCGHGNGLLVLPDEEDDLRTTSAFGVQPPGNGGPLLVPNHHVARIQSPLLTRQAKLGVYKNSFMGYRPKLWRVYEERVCGQSSANNPLLREYLMNAVLEEGSTPSRLMQRGYTTFFPIPSPAHTAENMQLARTLNLVAAAAYGREGSVGNRALLLASKGPVLEGSTPSTLLSTSFFLGASAQAGAVPPTATESDLGISLRESHTVPLTRFSEPGAFKLPVFKLKL